MTIDEKVIDILRTTGFEQAFEARLQQLRVEGRSEFEVGFGENLPSGPTSALEAMARAFEQRRPDFEAAVVRVYRQYLSDEEIGGLHAFYQSPIGQRFAAVGADLARALGETVSAWENQAIQSVEDDLRRLLADEVAGGAPTSKEEKGPIPTEATLSLPVGEPFLAPEERPSGVEPPEAA